MARCIVISCEHGKTERHLTRELPTAVSNEGWCEGGRVLDPPEWLQRLLEDPPPEPDDIEWCDFHEAGGAPGHDCWGAGLDGQDDCRMVRRPLLKPEGHE